jgi:hypothetical protein
MAARIFRFQYNGFKSTKNFTIADCIEYAFEHNPLISVGLTDSSIASVGIQRVKGLYLPEQILHLLFSIILPNVTCLLKGVRCLRHPPWRRVIPGYKDGYNNSMVPEL